MILERNLRRLIGDSLKKYPVVGLIGCRQVGKTTLAGRIIYHELKPLTITETGSSSAARQYSHLFLQDQRRSGD